MKDTSMLNPTITIHLFQQPQEPPLMKKPRHRAPPGPFTVPSATKMGRPRKSTDLRVSRGVRLDSDLVARAEAFIGRADLPHIKNFTALVEVSLKDWLARNENGIVRKVKLRNSPQKKSA
jgi:hypothetical protein